MSNIFKVIWNHATQTWTAVGELASAKGKSKSVKLAAISTALLAVAGGAQAAETAETLSTKVADDIPASVEKAAGNRGGLAIATNKVTNQQQATELYKKELERVTGKKLEDKELELGAKVYAYDGIAVGNGAVAGAHEIVPTYITDPNDPKKKIKNENKKKETTEGGNAHIAIGLMSKAMGVVSNDEVSGGSAADGATVALGAYSLATGYGSTAIGAHSVASNIHATALGKVANAFGRSSTALGQQTEATYRATAAGAEAKALGWNSTSVGRQSKVDSSSDNSISVGSSATVGTYSRDSTLVGSNSSLKGNKISSVGSNTNVSSNNVSTLGSNINVGSGRDGAVVLGHGSDAGGDSVVTAVNSAKATGSPLIYKGFAGNLGDKSKDATNSEASNQGRIVSVGDDTKEVKTTTTIANGVKTTVIITKNVITGKDVKKVEIVSKVSNGVEKITTTTTDLLTGKSEGPVDSEKGNAKPYTDSPAKTETQIIYGERQIQHVAAGEITEGSTNAINGSQLYQVAKTLGTAANQTANALGVTLNANGTLSPFSHQLNVTNSGHKQPANATNVTTALTQLNDYVNAGWSVGNNTTDAVSTILPNGKVNFIDGNGTTATVTKNGTNGANVTFNVKKDVTANTTTGLEANGSNNVLNVGKDGVSVVSGTIAKATEETKGEVKADDAKDNQVATVKNVVEAINSAGFVVSNGESGKSELINAGKTLTLQGGNGVNIEQDGSNFTFSIDSSKLLVGKTGGITVNQDKKAGETDAGKATVNNDDATKLATVKNVADAINGAKWFAKVENLSDSMNEQTQKDKDADAQAMGAGDILTLKADKNLAVKREGKNVTYGLASKIEVDMITVKAKAGETVKGTTVENGKVTNLDDHLKAPTKVTGGDVVDATEVKAPTLTDAQKKEAATVNDVLNAGWNLKTNGNQTAAITNGKGLDFASDDNSVTITPTVDKDGNAKVNFSVNATSVINNNKGTIKEAATDPKAANAGKVTVSDADKGKLATVDTVAEAINSAATFVKVADSQEVITASTADDNGVAVKSGETVTHTAGKNLKVKRDGKSVTYALAQDIDVDSVKAKNGVTIGSGDNATTITSDDKGLNLAGKNGVATNINNVKDADLNSTSKQAVNGSQLHATNEKVANLDTTVKNLNSVVNRQAGAIDSLDRKVNKHSKQARAGIAGANAAAALPQAYTQGKAMVAAAAGTFKGQNALAVGYSRISDNGKVILKLQGNANTSGDVGAGVGVGYQW